MNEALQAITKALNEGIYERTAMIIIITAVIIFIIILTAVIGLKNRKKIRTSAEASFQKLIRKHNLTILELDLIEELAASLKKPEDKYNLLISKSRFRQAEHKLTAMSEESQLRLEELKVKLGYIIPDVEPGIISTASFNRAMPVKISFNNEEHDAEIYSIADSSITVKFPNQSTPVTTDDEVILIAVTEGQPRVFKLYPDKIKGELFSAPHTESSEIEKISLKMDTVIERTVPDEEQVDEMKAKIIILSVEGAYIYDRKNMLHPEETVKIFLSNDHKKAYPTEAVVLKISEEKKLASVRFSR